MSASGPLTLITGASAGIGRQLSRALGGDGHRVLAVARRRERLEVLASEVPDLQALPADLADATERQALVERVLSHHGTPDYVVLNAGLAHYGALHKISAEQLAEQVQVNVLAVMDLVQRFLPAMLARGSGRLIVVSSVLGLTPIPYAAVYCGSKFAVNGFVRSLRMELKGTGVTISAMCPAGVATEFNHVATADPANERRGQQPVEQVVAGMVAKLDTDRAILYPTWQAWAVGSLGERLPRLMAWAMGGPGRAGFAAQLPGGRV